MQLHQPNTRRKASKDAKLHKEVADVVNPMISIQRTEALKMLSSLPDESLDLLFTSPPYNIGSKADRSDGRRKNGQYDPKSYGGIQGYADNLPEQEYQDGQVSLLTLAARKLKRDGVLVYNHKPRRRDGVMIHPMIWLSRVPNLVLMEEIIWDRGSTHNHSNRLFWPTTERLYVFRRADGEYRFHNDGRLKHRSDVWRVPLTSRPADGHAAPFPTPLADAVVAAYASAGDLVCDPYSGSGTTALAALRAGCDFIGSEQDRDYHANSLKRIENAKKESK